MSESEDPYLDDPFGDLLHRHKERVQEQSRGGEKIKLQISVEEARELALDLGVNEDAEGSGDDDGGSERTVGRNPRMKRPSVIRKTVRFSEAEFALLELLRKDRSISEVVRAGLVRMARADLDDGVFAEDVETEAQLARQLEAVTSQIDEGE